ncbi:MAG TPA: SRPBCC family protein [Thermoanaerobaculia bacterium]|nr:SRPBCC family protein [Thermoanaerobaculia bacterium]HXK66958.1 SRPBCC family protein [Thermoanaerobaculia bacterium]
MGLFKIERRQVIPVSLTRAWGFFSDPGNLSAMTPSDLHLVVEGNPPAMYEGMILTYRIRPVAGIAVRWVTEITHVREPHFFVDEQRMGPYRFWHHQHHFREVQDGVEVEDIVHYRIPWYPLSIPIHSLFIRPRLRGIFDYRSEKLRQIFPSVPVEEP